MQNLNLANVQTIASQFLAQNANAQTIASAQQNAEAQIVSMLHNVKVQFASIVQCTQVACAAAHKHITILKVSYCNITVASDAQNLYLHAVQNSASKIAQDEQNIANFTTSAASFTHTNCYSIVKNNNSNKLYLFALYNKTHASAYYCVNTNTLLTIQQVAQYLTASAAKTLLNVTNVTHNVTNNVTHTVVPRTISLQNIISLNANKQQYVA